MRRRRRIPGILLALVLALSCCLSATAEEAYPTEWDLSKIYADSDAWQQDFDKAMELIPQHEAYRGTLNTAQGLYDYYQFAYLGEMTRLQSRLALYANLGNSLNPADPVYNNMLAQLANMGSAESQYSAFVQSELFSLPMETRQAIVDDPLLADWKYALRNLVDPHQQPLSEETNTVLAILGPALGRASSVFDIMNSVDLPDPMIAMPDGSEIALTQELYTRIINSDEYDRDFKGLCNQVILTKPVAFVNTFAALLESNAALNWSTAQINRYDSCREAAMAASDVDPAIYDMLIAAAHKGAPDYQRYLNAHKRGLQLDVQYPFDTADYVSDFAVKEIPYEEAVAEVREALSILGEDYIAAYDAMIESGHLDVYPSDTKVTGAFSMSMGDEFMPFMLFNYVGYSLDVSTLAHEMGHAVYSSMSMQNQNRFYAEPTIFTHEVASTTNELLYYTYKINHAATDDERLFYLENILSMFSDTFFTQSLFAEFEDALYKTVEAGGSLDAEVLSDLYAALYETYRGDAVMAFPDARYQWATVPHFYYNYYVYQYATSVSYAASICQRIIAGEEGALESYLEFLSLGSSNDPASLLTVAGVNPLDEAAYQYALDFYKGLVDEYERLVDAKLAASAS